MLQLRLRHDRHLAQISQALLQLQGNLLKKEKVLGQVIEEREQTIAEQQRVIRRLLRRGRNAHLKPAPAASKSDAADSDLENIGSEGGNVEVEDGPMEFSISVPNLQETSHLHRNPAFNRSISDTEEKEREASRVSLAASLASERRARNREKLLAMKRYSGFLKRPEILETVYSVEDPEDQGLGQEPVLSNGDQVEEKPAANEDAIARRESETTEYDCSTDDESLRFLMSETDQSAGCSGLCSRQSSSGSQHNLQAREEEERPSRSMEDVRAARELMEKRKKFRQNKVSVSLDHCEDG